MRQRATCAATASMAANATDTSLDVMLSGYASSRASSIAASRICLVDAVITRERELAALSVHVRGAEGAGIVPGGC